MCASSAASAQAAIKPNTTMTFTALISPSVKGHGEKKHKNTPTKPLEKYPASVEYENAQHRNESQGEKKAKGPWLRLSVNSWRVVCVVDNHSVTIWKCHPKNQQ
jgi:hypothetical protein